MNILKLPLASCSLGALALLAVPAQAKGTQSTSQQTQQSKPANGAPKAGDGSVRSGDGSVQPAPMGQHQHHH